MENFKILGLLLGYPECCVDAFCRGEAHGIGKHITSYNGFIPCLDCNAKYPDREAITKMLGRDPANEPDWLSSYCKRRSYSGKLKLMKSLGRGDEYKEIYERVYGKS